MRSKKNSYRNSEEKSQPKSVMPPEIFNSIENLCLDLWWKIDKTGNVSLLAKEKPKKLYKFLFYCSDIWDEIKDEHIKTFGIPPEYLDYLAKKTELGIRIGNYGITQDRKEITWINIAQMELDSLGEMKVENNYKTKNIIEVSLGLPRINPKEIMTIEYYNLIELVKQKS